jgi:hypothetical protein
MRCGSCCDTHATRSHRSNPPFMRSGTAKRWGGGGPPVEESDFEENTTLPSWRRNRDQE